MRAGITKESQQIFNFHFAFASKVNECKGKFAKARRRHLPIPCDNEFQGTGSPGSSTNAIVLQCAFPVTALLRNRRSHQRRKCKRQYMHESRVRQFIRCRDI